MAGVENWTLTVNGVDQTARVAKRSLALSRSRGARAQMQLTLQDIKSDASAYRPDLDWPVVLTVNGTVRFGGMVIDVSDSPLGGIRSGTKSDITVTDYDIFLDRTLVSMTFVAGTTHKQIAQYLVANHLTVFGVTLDPTMQDGPALTTDFPVVDAKAKEILEALTTLSGWISRITPARVLEFFAPGTKAASWALNGSTCRSSVPWRRVRSAYANQIILRFTRGATVAYAFFGSPGPNFTDGETVAVGGQTYKFVSGDPTQAGDVKIGVDWHDTVTRLSFSINGTPKDPALMGDAGANSQVVAMMYSNAMKVVAKQGGASGNSVGCTENTAVGRWYTEGGGDVTTLQLGSDESLTNAVRVQDDADVLAKGPWPKRVDAQWCFDENLAMELAQGELRRAKQATRELSAASDAGFALPGDMVPVSFPFRLLSGSWAIETIQSRLVSPTRFWHELTLSEGTELGVTWGESIRQLTTGGSSVSVSGVGLLVSGGGGGGEAMAQVLGALTYPLGGSENDFVQSAAPADWVPATPNRIFHDTTLETRLHGTARVRLRAIVGSVQARLYNVTLGTIAGSGPPITNINWVEQSFDVTMNAGAYWYELQVLPSLPLADVAAAGYLDFPAGGPIGGGGGGGTGGGGGGGTGWVQ